MKASWLKDEIIFCVMRSELGQDGGGDLDPCAGLMAAENVTFSAPIAETRDGSNIPPPQL